MRPVYFIIPTAGIGGAEKRFIELWCFLKRAENNFQFNLIISKALHQEISLNPALSGQLRPYLNNILTYEIPHDQPVITFQKKLYGYVCAHTSNTDILHFILYFPTYIFPLTHNKTIYSLTESSLSNVNIKGRLLYFLNVLRSHITDVLDPIVHKKLQRYFFFKRKKIHLTPGSFTDIDLFKPVPGNEKENLFVFLGRFFYVKQVIKLLKALPEICQHLSDAGITKDQYKFVFIGYGQQEEEMRSIILSNDYKTVPFEITSSYQPENILAKSKVIFSLQLRNNYPSKSLQEGMATGNIPLVTDVGTTRLIAQPGCSYYVPEDFSAADIATQLIAILTLPEKTLQMKMQNARDIISRHFTIESSAKYYMGLYNGFNNI